ncbi:hypothetical protein DES53_104487 [Roseimicrobium gellanilyticum]|uniref:Vitamin K-dependent gamma-carboxylase-like protein n=1 Tax=Roseimicrobium gellanilyticum TaxID=748857 RepID=A0A366HR32_9BACT|nr:hypothetical protein [Roseimicrobium gellanilyticum]RBP44664.1 hypothetical protein DES53_104487 [Roseimicrobium gellanilyticum]
MSSLSRTLTPPSDLHLQRHASGSDRFQFGPLEMTLMRLFFAVLVFFAIKWETGNLHPVKTDDEDAVGLARIFSLDFLIHLKPLVLWQIITILGLIAYVASMLPVVGLLPALFFTLCIGALNASQGAHNHSTQLVAMILLGQFLVYAVPLTMEKRGPKLTWLMPEDAVHRRALYVSLVIFAAAYVVCGWVKLDNSDWKWFGNVVPGLALELQKTNWSAYYDTLEPVPAALTSVVGLMNDHPTLARLFFGAGLLIELFAFLILLGRRWAFGYGLLIILMHLSISRLMQLDFWYHIVAALIFLVNVPGVKATFTKAKAR